MAVPICTRATIHLVGRVVSLGSRAVAEQFAPPKEPVWILFQRQEIEFNGLLTIQRPARPVSVTE